MYLLYLCKYVYISNITHYHINKLNNMSCTFHFEIHNISSHVPSSQGVSPRTRKATYHLGWQSL